MTNISLKLRITLLVGVILTFLTIILTLFSIMGTNRYFVEPQKRNGVSLQRTEVTDVSKINCEKVSRATSEANISSQVSVTEAEKNFFIESVLLSVVIILLGISLTYMIMGKALKPLTNLSKTIYDINEHTLNKLILVNNSGDEIRSLSISFNKMIDRIKNAFSKQKYFAANAAHELKTPLATMKTAVQVIELDDFPSQEDYREAMVVIKQNVDRMIDTVNDLFLLSFEGSTNLNDTISLNYLFHQVVKELEIILRNKNISCTLPEKDCLIIGNYILLHSVFFNIFENAVKYNKKNGLIIVKLKNLGNEKVQVSIEDTGIGMTKEEIESAFDPFFRSTYAINQQIPGNGLGLSVVKTIINRHAGQITLGGKLDEGTKVTIILEKKFV